MITAVVQRWRDRRDTYRPAGETIDTRAYDVAPVATHVAFEEGPDLALKAIVRAGLVEHSMKAPILFRGRPA